ncbi:GNAT family N-acetyltransferase [Nocardioides nitrophenolicus]|uniref:GNAT family N-acetyltransferase n=1 Tax=Nocardioides nitrophenolicus TaxID=60489 RepID=UPI0027DC28F6|nr:GNAT family N-acetyltransferase [Nocardioides nitrophenolicus]MBM7517717.1 GNAT superfamily N-acetyltransferase [Nocardioides nitrophenolicus]
MNPPPRHPDPPRLRPAAPGEAAALTELALRSKGHWGYDAAFLESCRDELTVREDELGARRTVVAELPDGRIAGFRTLEGEPPVGVLGMMFVDPDAIGRGIGGALARHLVAEARAAGFTRLTIDADPNAEAFYLAQGAVRVGATPSGSIPGRVLPLLELRLEPAGHC